MYSFFEWLKKVQNEEAMAAAPATKPPVKPAPPITTPKPNTKPRPWYNPPNPATDQPKAEKKKLILQTEVYERDVDPYVRRFASEMVRNREHPFGLNPLTAMNGERLIKKGYEDFRPAYDAHGYSPNQAMMQVFRVLGEINKIESKHKKKLEEAAVKLASKYTGIPEEYFHAYLSRTPSPEEGAGERYSNLQMNPKKRETLPVTPELRDQINKRINLNLLTQGHALHIMDFLHEDIKDTLEAINKDLPKLYTKLSLGTKGTYYFTDSIKQAQSAAARAGSSVGEVNLVKKPETDQVEIHAHGVTFPFLVQELIKGAMDLAASNQFTNLSEKEKNTILAHADKFEDEPWHFIMGVPMWQHFLDMLPEEYVNNSQKTMQIVAAFAQKDPKVANKILQDAIEELHGTRDTTKINQVIRDMIDEFENPTSSDDTGETDEGSDWTPDTDDDSDWSPDKEDEDEDEEYEKR